MTIEELEQVAKSVCQENEKYDFEVNVCMDLACMSQGADRLREALEKAAGASDKHVLVRRTGCMGPCSSGRWFALTPRNSLSPCECRPCRAIVASLAAPVPELQCDLNDHFDAGASGAGECRPHRPEKIDDYIARDGYKGSLLH